MLPTPPTSPHSTSTPTFDGPPPVTAGASISPRPDKRASGNVAASASAYPTPPPTGTLPQTAQFIAGRHAHMPSIQGQLEIPPYNPNKRRQSAGQQAEQLSSPTVPPPSRRPQAAPRPASVAIYPHSSATTADEERMSSRSRSSVASSIPAAYAGKQRVFFGPYLLLQTLGEGEFGKVKLGTHLERPGEEVAIKLIKRGTVQDSEARMAKVAREIGVLKVVKHPNIVRLRNVIETEKYIGIVLEYASGGELFDHILAHRYLKERDACKLFAQLISGVSYLHGKKIVHRDLKLENLLLDRNRNIIITDFGFANRYHDKADDLMSTSCGSPCYAAPELVVQDGKYVGSAVDVWSCGVILYAMLAGYLPFDDDPNNPEGDNINMLYRYIINTPLSFPEWIPTEPRDLLLRMLVPDPLRRATLEDVARHPWLRRYREVFTKTVEELEAIADAQDRRKAELIEQRRQAATDLVQGAVLSRSQSTSLAPRHQSAMIPVSATATNLASPPSANTRAGRRAQVASAIVTSAVGTGDFNFTPTLTSSPLESVPMTLTSSAPGRTSTQNEEPISPPAASTRAAEARRRKAAQAAHRYTVQVEYDPGTASYSHSSAKGKGKALEPELTEEAPMQAVETLVDSPPTIPLEAIVSAPAELAEPAIGEEQEMLVDDASRAAAEPQLEQMLPEALPTLPPAAVEHTPEEMEEANAAPLIKAEPSTPEKPKVATIPEEPGTPRGHTTRVPSQPFPSPERERERAAAELKLASSTPSRIPKSSTTSAVSTLSASTARPERSAAARASRHSKGMSTDNRFLNRLLGGNPSQSSIEKVEASSATSSINAPATPRNRRTSTLISEASDDGRRKSNRRKALSMVVEPFTSSPKRKTRTSDVVSQLPPVTAPVAATRTSSRPSTAKAAMPPPAVPASAVPSPATPVPELRQSPRKAKAEPEIPRRSGATVPSVPPSKAKRVMDWFRWRSLSRDTAVNETMRPPLVADLAPLEFAEAPAVKEEAPTVVVTAEAEEPQSVPSSRSASGAHSEVSDAPTTTTVATSVTSASATLATKSVAPSGASIASTAGSINEVFSERQLRFHNGAVDQNALTSRLPTSVVADIRKVLWDMGIDAREEAGQFRLRCQRPSQRKPALTISTTQGSGTSTLPPSSSMSALSASPSTAFRAFFNRRNSSTSSPASSAHGHSSVVPSPALTQSTMTWDSPQLEPSLTRSASSAAIQPVAWIGSDDSGGEVRFSVEIARIKGLNNLYSVDLRRLKGSLFEYRAIYLEVLKRLELSA